MIINDLVIRSANRDREREVSQFAAYNKIEKSNNDKAASNEDSPHVRKHNVSSWILMFSKMVNGVFASN